MAVYAFANGKGGVGKTATTRNVGTELARSGHEAVVVDGDLTMSNIDGDTEDGLQAVLAGECALADALVAAPDGTTALPGQRSLAAVGAADATALPGVLDRLDERFEFVLVDTPAGLRDELALALEHADGTFVVTTPRETALANGRQTARLASRAGGTVLGAVVVRATPDTDRERVESVTGLPVVGLVSDDPAVDPSTPVARDALAREGYERLARLVDACRSAADPVEAIKNAETPSLPESATGGPSADRADHEETERDADEEAAEPAGDVADGLLDGNRMGTARSAEEHLERLQDAMDRADDDA